MTPQQALNEHVENCDSCGIAGLCEHGSYLAKVRDTEITRRQTTDSDVRLRRLEDAVLYLLDRADTFHRHEARRRQEPVRRPEKLRASVADMLASKHERGDGQ